MILISQNFFLGHNDFRWAVPLYITFPLTSFLPLPPPPPPPPTNFVVTNKSAKFFSLTQGGLTYQLSTYN